MEFRQNFLWTNENKLTTKEKIWYLETCIYWFAEYFPNLYKPKSFNEKINWMKLNYDDSQMKRCVDKYEFKKYIEEKLGKDYVARLYGVYENVNEINFEDLPEKFVLKSTLSGAGRAVEIVDKKNTNIDKLKYKFNNQIQQWKSMYYTSFSSAYKGLTPRIIAEEYIPEIENSPNEYKMFCFYGEPKLFYTINYTGKKKWTYYDMELNRLPFRNVDYSGSHKMSSELIHKPTKNFNKMIEISKLLSKDFPFVRVDFYDTGDRVLVGELTFTPTGGYGKYTPREWDYKLGELLDLSKIPEENLKILPEFAEGAKTFIDPDVVDRCTVRNNQMENNVCVCK